ncbi:MAG TPA: hypothetical protein VG838_13775 [Opitutaceae bacterium]|nr:hypothetical protein [Opitutaceae bacterium]
MIKLESTSPAPVASAIFAVQCVGSQPAITLTTTDAWKPSDDDWLRDDTKRKQIVAFINDEGRTVEILGAVPEGHAVEIGAAHKVVCLVTLKLDRKSGQMRLAVQRVVEVWTAPGKRLWTAPDWQNAAASGPTMTEGGKITKAA